MFPGEENAFCDGAKAGRARVSLAPAPVEFALVLAASAAWPDDKAKDDLMRLDFVVCDDD